MTRGAIWESLIALTPRLCGALPTERRALPGERLDHVRGTAYCWMLEYNEARAHDPFGDLATFEYAITAINSDYELSP
jgi:hypothetical protein